jgi:hypothetical protein
LRRVSRAGSLLGLMVLLTGCQSTTVLLANFNSDTVGAPPAATQATGTVSMDLGAGTVTVVDAPAADLPANKWAQISHPNAPSPQTAMTGRFASPGGPGNYGLLTSLFIPSGAGIVTVQFEPFGQPPDSYANFMHLDFMPEDDVRVDDGAVRFGQFPRDQTFALSVNLAITTTGATASISLLGSGASGSVDVPVDPTLAGMARNFGAVKFWMGFQSQGTFFVDDVLVTRRNP